MYQIKTALCRSFIFNLQFCVFNINKTRYYPVLEVPTYTGRLHRSRRTHNCRCLVGHLHPSSTVCLSLSWPSEPNLNAKYFEKNKTKGGGIKILLHTDIIAFLKLQFSIFNSALHKTAKKAKFRCKRKTWKYSGQNSNVKQKLCKFVNVKTGIN